MTDLWSIAAFAPLVVAARAQILAMEAFHPTAKGQREVRRMMREKPLAIAEAALAAQKALFQGSGKRRTNGAKTAAPFSPAAPADALHAAAAATRRRVRQNARRLTKF